MSEYKVGDKVVLTVTSKVEDPSYSYYILSDDAVLLETTMNEDAEPLSTYTEPLEDTIQKYTVKIARLVMEKEELKDENERLKAENEKMSVKIDAYELCGDQHEEEYNQAFNQGAEAAWELARKIILPQSQGGMSIDDYVAIFGSCISEVYIMKNYTYTEAAAKVAEWEGGKDEIKVGDIVRIHEGNDDDLCILYVSTDKKYYNAVDEYGAVYNMLTKGMITKTGRHIDIDSFLKQIGGNRNER